MPTLTRQALILHSCDYGEADRIVTFFCRAEGLCKGFARNARQSRKRFGAALEPFASVELLLGRPRRGELYALKESTLLDLRGNLRNDLVALATAALCCELVEHFGGGLEHEETFALLTAGLDALNRGDEAETVRLLFDLRLLALSGYLPHLLHCSICNRPLQRDPAAFSAASGGALCPDCAGRDALSVGCGTLGTFSRLLRTPTTLFAGIRPGPTTRNEGRQILDDALRLHLTRPLRSLAFLYSVLPPAG